MRIRTLAALATGAALGAGGTWLLDPDAGRQRRREALREAGRRTKDVNWTAVAVKTGDVAVQLGRRAADGYREGVRS